MRMKSCTSQLSGEILFSMKLWMNEQTPSSLSPWDKRYKSNFLSLSTWMCQVYNIHLVNLDVFSTMYSNLVNLDVERQTSLLQGGEPPAGLIVIRVKIDTYVDSTL